MAKSKHASAPKRKKKFAAKAFNPHAMFDVIRDNWRASAVAANESLANADALRQRFSRPVGGEQQQELAYEYSRAMVRLNMGGGDLSDWCLVLDALNTGCVLAERGFGPEHVQTFIVALQGMTTAHTHFKATGKWAFSAEVNAAINDGIDVHAAQLEHAIQADVMSAFAEVARRIENDQIIKEAA